MWSWILGHQTGETVNPSIPPVAITEKKVATGNVQDAAALCKDIMQLLSDIQSNPRYEMVKGDVQKVSDAVNELSKVPGILFAKGDQATENINQLRADGGIGGFVSIISQSMSQIMAVLSQAATVPEGSSYYNPYTWVKYGNNLLTEVQQLLKLIPVLLESYEKLGVSSFLAKHEFTLKTLKQSASDKLSSTIQNSLENFVKTAESMEALQALSLSNDETSLETFYNLPEVTQNAILVAMQEINDSIGKSLVFLDGMETSMGFNEGLIFNSIDMELTFPKESPLAQTAFNNLSLSKLFFMVREAYMTRMAMLDKPIRHDVYPFTTTIYHERLALLNSLKNEMILGEAEIGEKCKQGVQTDLRNFITHLDTKISAYTSKINGLEAPEAQSFVAALELSQQLQFMEPDAALKRLQSLSPTEDRPGDKVFWSQVQQLEQIYKNAIRYYENWHKEKIQVVHQLEEKIKVSLDKDPTLANTQPYIPEKRYDAVRDNVKIMVADAQEIINELFPPAEKPKTPQESKVETEAAFNLKEQIKKAEDFLKHTIDPELYHRFVENREKTEEKLPFKDVANALNAAKDALDYLEQFKNGFASNKERLPSSNVEQSVARLTPSQSLALTASHAKGVISSSKALAKAVKQLQTDPLINEYFGSMKAKGQNAWSQFIKKDGQENLNEIHSAQKVFFDTLNKFLSDNKNNSALLEKEKIALHNLVTNLQHIWKDTSPYIDAGTLSFGEMVSIVSTHYSELFALKNDLQSLLTSAQKISEESKLALLKQLHTLCKQTYLLLDKMEGQLGLKDGILTHHPIFQGKPILGYIKDFETLAQQFDYPLRFNDLYPYADSVLKQREELVKAIDAKTDPIKHRVATERLAAKYNEIDNDREEYLESLKRQAPQLHAINIINRRIAELEENKKSYFVIERAIKDLKISFLSKLREGLKTHSYKEAVISLKEHKGYLKYLPRIFDGKTQKKLKEIELGSMTKQDMRKNIEDAIKVLSKKKTSRFRFFTSEAEYDLRIKALQALEASIQPSNPTPLDKDYESLLKRHEPNVYSSVLRWVEIRDEQAKLVQSLTNRPALGG